MTSFDTVRGLARRGVIPVAPEALDSLADPPPADLAHVDRLEGMLLGLAIGDALGNTSEGWTAGQPQLGPVARGLACNWLPGTPGLPVVARSGPCGGTRCRARTPGRTRRAGARRAAAVHHRPEELLRFFRRGGDDAIRDVRAGAARSRGGCAAHPARHAPGSTRGVAGPQAPRQPGCGVARRAGGVDSAGGNPRSHGRATCRERPVIADRVACVSRDPRQRGDCHKRR
jgi:hypothetical protein